MASKIPVSKPDGFGNKNPWAEPAWHNSLNSPYYNDSHRRLRNFMRSYIETKILPYSWEWEEAGEVPEPIRQEWVHNGFLLGAGPNPYSSVPLPAGIKDSEWDVFHKLVFNDELNRIVPAGVMSGLSGGSAIGVPPIMNFGTQKQKDEWVRPVYEGKASFVLGSTEPSGGSDVANLRTTARKTEDGRWYVVNGAKKWITGGLLAKYMTTSVRTGGKGAGGISVLVIPLDAEGVSRRKIYNSGVNASGTAWIDLVNVKVPVENLIGEENKGFKILMGNFNSERFLMCTGMNRIARTCLSEAMQYANDRETFGKPLIEHEVIRFKFSEMGRQIEAHWAWLEQLAYHIHTEGPQAWASPEIGSRLALGKVMAGQNLEKAVREAQQIFGGAGYQRGKGAGRVVEQISRDFRMMVVGGGSEEIISDMAVRMEVANCKRKGARL